MNLMENTETYQDLSKISLLKTDFFNKKKKKKKKISC